MGKHKRKGLAHGGWRPGAGRPKLPDTERREYRVTISMSSDELERFRNAAHYMGYDKLSAFATECVWSMLDRVAGGEGANTQPKEKTDD